MKTITKIKIFKKEIDLEDLQSEFYKIDVAILILTHIPPIFGLVLLGWDVIDVLFLFGFEVVVVGFFNIIKLIWVRGTKRSPVYLKFIMIPFFMVHFVIFLGACYIGIIAVLTIYKQVILDASGLAAIWQYALQPYFSNNVLNLNNLLFYNYLLILISHATAFSQNFLKGEENIKMTVDSLMRAPYWQIFITQVWVVGGAAVILEYQWSFGWLSVSVMIKLFTDFYLRYLEHYKYGI